MRGRRAFAILSGYLILLAAFAWMVELMMERTYSTSFGGSAAFATAAIGQGIFAAVLMLETLVVVFLATMTTAGSISLEREKQTLEMLAATPITSFAIVLGKLLSALIYVWLLIAASIPLTAIVFVFGGVAPDDLVRGYIVLIVTALGFGAFGLFCSSLVKRTQAATAIALFGVLAISMGTLFVIVFWNSLATPVVGPRRRGAQGLPAGRPDLHQPVHRPGRHRAGRSPVRDRLHAQRLLQVPLGVRPAEHGSGLRPPGQHRRRRRARDRRRAGHPAGQGRRGDGGVVAHRRDRVPSGHLAAARRRRRVRLHRASPSGRGPSSPGRSCPWSSCSCPSSSSRPPDAGACAGVRPPSRARRPTDADPVPPDPTPSR